MKDNTQNNKEKSENTSKLPFGKKNYMLMVVGLGVLIFGYLLMIGGGSDNPDFFNYELFSFQRLTLAPIVLLIGFLIEFYAIMYRPKA